MTGREAPPRVRNLVFDIHGVLLGRTEPPGHRPASAVLADLAGRGHRIRFVTNGSSVSRAAVADALAEVGVAATPSDVFTAGTTVGTYLAARPGAPTPRRVFVIGSEELRREITRVAGDAVRWSGPAEADVVVVSRAPDLAEATLDELRGNSAVRLVATCRDARFADGDRLVAGPGPTVERVEQALGKTAHVLGKPNHYVLTDVMGLRPRDIAETLVIGDSVDQDVMLARNAGARWALLAGPVTGAAPPADDPLCLGPITALDELLELV
jgi:HAD superfamily hydrolase (TIGR01450 family)